MRTVVVYESMYGNTHQVAERMAAAAARHGEAVCVPVGKATAEVLADADLVMVGGPTHAHGMSSAMSRKGAVADAPKHQLEPEPDAAGSGLRDWFRSLGAVVGTKAVAFDTRFDANPLITGRASKGIGKHLTERGYRLVAEPESFIVDKQNHLLPGEADRAAQWAEQVLTTV